MNRIQRGNRGFTLVELLTVLAIMAVLTGLSIPAIQGARSTYNRQAAVDIVMTTVEQARMAALQSGENVYVILAKATDGGVSPDALIVAGDPAIGSLTTGKVLITRWIKLPLNVRFRSSDGTLAVNDLPSGVTSDMLPSIGGQPLYSGFTFNSTGTMAYPVSGGLDLALYEGIRKGDGTETAQGASAHATDGLSDSGLYEVIRFSRYNGRSWADVSNLLQK